MREPVERLLRDAGWVPGRAQSIDEDLDFLEASGFPATDPVKSFLREFSGLVVRFLRNEREDEIWLDLRRAARWADPEWVAEYMRRVGVPLVPIGYANHEHLMLLETQDGRFFGAFDDFLGSLGSSPDEMI